jgi:hypothetical protein
LSSQARLRNVTPDKYRAHISGLLESPDSIWQHAFQYQISNAAQHVLLCLYTLGDYIETCDLEPAFTSLHRHSAAKYHQPIAAGDFRKALQELDGAFLSYSRGHASYLNPSIREFVASAISNSREISENLLVSAIRFKQVVNLWRLSKARANGELDLLLASDVDLFLQSLARLLYGPKLRWEKMGDGSRRGYSIDMGDEARIGFLVEVSNARQSKRVAALALQAANNLVASWSNHAPEFSAVIGLLERLPKNPWLLSSGGYDMYRDLLDAMLDQLSSARAHEWLDILAFQGGALGWTEEDERHRSDALKHYRQDGVDDERRDCSTLDEISELRDSLAELAKKFGLDFSDTIRNLDEEIAERDDSRDDDGEGYSYGGSTSGSFQETISDDDVAQMFSTLHDGH